MTSTMAIGLYVTMWWVYQDGRHEPQALGGAQTQPAVLAFCERPRTPIRAWRWASPAYPVAIGKIVVAQVLGGITRRWQRGPPHHPITPQPCQWWDFHPSPARANGADLRSHLVHETRDAPVWTCPGRGTHRTYQVAARRTSGGAFALSYCLTASVTVDANVSHIFHASVSICSTAFQARQHPGYVDAQAKTPACSLFDPFMWRPGPRTERGLIRTQARYLSVGGLLP